MDLLVVGLIAVTAYWARWALVVTEVPAHHRGLRPRTAGRSARSHVRAVPSAILLGLYTGMRSSELRGLRWSDVDLERGTYRVSSTVHRIGRNAERIVGARGVVAGRPTNDGSGRKAALSKAALSILVEHRKRQPAAQMSAASWHDDEYVVNHLRRDSGRCAHGRAPLRGDAGRAGVPTRTPDSRGRGLHELRRSFATLLGDVGVPPEEDQQRGLWTSTQMLLDAY